MTLACTLPLVYLARSICYYPEARQLAYATWSKELPCRTKGRWQQGRGENINPALSSSCLVGNICLSLQENRKSEIRNRKDENE